MLARNQSNHNGTCVIIGNDDTLGRKASDLVKVYFFFLIFFFSLSLNSLIFYYQTLKKLNKKTKQKTKNNF